MKLIIAVSMLVLFSCKTEEKKETIAMQGAYNMLSQTMNDGTKDSSFSGSKQLKMFTDDYMMYVFMNTADSASGFGIGTYTADTSGVVENVIYNAADSSKNDSPSSFTLVIEKTPKGYKQVRPERITRSGNKIKLTEEYESVGTSAKSALDGAWKQIKGYNVKGKDSITRTGTQYKIYAAGHFMFGNTYADSTNKLHTGIGYGTFEMMGTNKVKENVTVSTYYEIRGKSFEIDITLKGADEFTQTITDTDGTKNIEVYQRLKK